jgi:hypothetical protein
LKPTQVRSLAENTYFYTENLSIFYSYYDRDNLPFRFAGQHARWHDKIEKQKLVYQSRLAAAKTQN